jgi:hypothetical protein
MAAALVWLVILEVLPSMSFARRAVFSCLLSVLSSACASPQVAPAAPPSSERDPSAPTTSDGEVVGADRVPPSQKLEQGPRVDTNDGVKPAATPPAEPR